MLNSRTALPLAGYNIGTWHAKHSCIGRIVGQAFGSVGWPSANRAYYVGVTLDRQFLFDQFYLAIGSAAGNIDLGVYDYQTLAKIVSTGSTAASGTAQFISVAKTLLKPGPYLLAMAASSTSLQPMRTQTDGSANRNAMLVLYSQNTALPLPSTATISTVSTDDFCPLFGMVNSQA